MSVDFTSITKLNRRAVSFGSGSVYLEVSSRDMFGCAMTSSRRIHLMQVFPSQPGRSSRTGYPAAGRSASPFSAYASERVVEHLLQRDAAGEHRRVAAFRQHPARVRPDAGFAEQRGDPHAGPLRVRGHPVDLLRRQLPLRRAVTVAAVAGAFEEVDAGDRRQPPEIGQREG